MGKLHYGGQSFEMEDRLLAHLQLIIGTKLRRGENFFMTWRAPTSSGEGRHGIWIDNGVPIHVEYAAGGEPDINRSWAESLADSASKGGGLFIHAEEIPLPPPPGPESDRPH